MPESKSLELFECFEFFDFGCILFGGFGDCKYVEFHLFGGQAESAVVTEVSVFELFNQRADEYVILGVGPRITECKVVFGFISEGMPESELEAFLSLGDAVLLEWGFGPSPSLVVLVLVNWKVALPEKFDLVAHVD